MQAFPVRGRVFLGVVVTLLLLFLAAHVYAVLARADREPHMDETEYLHAGWLMANGGRLYQTFFEHHSPFLFKALEPLAPIGERTDVLPYFIHARWLTGACGLVALLALAALLWRAAPEAAPIAVGLLVAAGPLWLRGFAEVRAEAFSLAFFFLGAALVIWCRGWPGGIGAGLIVVAGMWNPKWPLACAAVALVWLFTTRKRIASSIAAAVTVLLAFGALRLIVPLDMWWFFNFDMNVALAHAVETTPWVLDTYFRGGIPFLYVPAAFHPWIVVPAALLVLASLRIERSAARALPLILLAASFLEIRLIFPWPAIWAHYYLMWGIAAAGVLALVPSSLALLLSRGGKHDRLAGLALAASTALALLLTLAHVIAIAPGAENRATYFVSARYLRERLRPGEIVWLEPSRHPVSVRDAHYYWFSVGQMASAAHEMRKTARGARYLAPDSGFPVCTLPPGLRYTLDPRRPMPAGEVTACMQRLLDSGEARRTIFSDVYEVRLKSAPTRSR